MIVRLVAAAVVITATASCVQPTEPTGASQEYPDVIEVQVERNSDGTYRFDVTISSPYDSPERYADAWRIKSEDGTVYGVRELLHDHAGEQPFTRSLREVEIPESVETVVVEARDLVNGWGGGTLEIDLP